MKYWGVSWFKILVQLVPDQLKPYYRLLFFFFLKPCNPCWFSQKTFSFPFALIMMCVMERLRCSVCFSIFLTCCSCIMGILTRHMVRSGSSRWYFAAQLTIWKYHWWKCHMQNATPTPPNTKPNCYECQIANYSPQWNHVLFCSLKTLGLFCLTFYHPLLLQKNRGSFAQFSPLQNDSWKSENVPCWGTRSISHSSAPSVPFTITYC